MESSIVGPERGAANKYTPFTPKTTRMHEAMPKSIIYCSTCVVVLHFYLFGWNDNGGFGFELRPMRITVNSIFTVVKVCSF